MGALETNEQSPVYRYAKRAYFIILRKRSFSMRRRDHPGDQQDSVGFSARSAGLGSLPHGHASFRYLALNDPRLAVTSGPRLSREYNRIANDQAANG